MNTQQIKVAIADDHKIFRDGIKMALSGRDHIKFLWEAEMEKTSCTKLQ
jgi:DNA-binding NarL/FixJ family response regulator